MPRVRGNSVDIAMSKILKKINNYELLSGNVVSDLELSKAFNMSRTPIREAIFKLIDAGVLERTATKVVVKAITLIDIREILDFRNGVELTAIKTIYRNGGFTENQRKELKEIHENLKDDIGLGKFDDNFTHDALFHTKMVSFSNNSRILKVYEQLNIQAKRLRSVTLLTPGRYVETLQEHNDIIEAVGTNDFTKLERAIENHIEKTYRNYEQILNNDRLHNLMKELPNMRAT